MTSTKFQINSNFQNSMTKTISMLFWTFGHWDLEFICYLFFVIWCFS